MSRVTLATCQWIRTREHREHPRGPRQSHKNTRASRRTQTLKQTDAAKVAPSNRGLIVGRRPYCPCLRRMLVCTSKACPRSCRSGAGAIANKATRATGKRNTPLTVGVCGSVPGGSSLPGSETQWLGTRENGAWYGGRRTVRQSVR